MVTGIDTAVEFTGNKYKEKSETKDLLQCYFSYFPYGYLSFFDRSHGYIGKSTILSIVSDCIANQIRLLQIYLIIVKIIRMNILLTDCPF